MYLRKIAKPWANTSALPTLLLIANLACGGAPNPGPMPLSHHFDDMYIAAVPLSEKQAVLKAQQAYSVAKMERAKAAADLEESLTQLEVAKNKRQVALLEESSAKSRAHAADKSGDGTRINRAKREMRVAELTRRAADIKVEMVTAERTAYAAALSYRTENMYAREAMFELAKARVARARNIRPKAFDVAHYEDQYKQRSKTAQRLKLDADRTQAELEAIRKRWKAMVEQAERSRGGTGVPETTPPANKDAIDAGGDAGPGVGTPTGRE